MKLDDNYIFFCPHFPFFIHIFIDLRKIILIYPQELCIKVLKGSYKSNRKTKGKNNEYTFKILI